MRSNQHGRKQVSVRGVVQGVGFRPFVYRLARDHGLSGWVLNHSGGVEIEVEGQHDSLEAFVHDLSAQAPPLARIVAVEVADAAPAGYDGFEIRHSVAEEGRYQLISPDIATCGDCLQELLDPADRRYRYPFTNCTNCGPRFTIIRDIPYDRPLTTMRPFVMCPACQREYDDPLDRRFHAQPNACPVCGPQVWLEAAGQPGARLAEGDEALRSAARLLLEGNILAIKGLGGFHLACDATDAKAVGRLRARKGRPAKPMAVMVASLDEIRLHCSITEAEEALLISQQCPIVLLTWRRDSRVVAEVAPGSRYLGVMLPYTPLHHVLLRDAGRPLVMTSGNLSEEPIAQGNEEARRRLGHLADAFLLHDRDIYARYDDSVVLMAGRPAGADSGRREVPQFIRRSRGYAPFPIRLPFQARRILATGPELKNTFCLARDDFAFVSQHIGDMENLETLEHFEASIELYKHLFRVEPEIVAYDLHPDYFATKYALARAPDGEPGVPRIPVQHHEAHIAACMADNGHLPEAGPVIGVAWDGTGLGRDGHIWGGEFLVGDYRGCWRAAHLEYLPMPGGEAAIRHPWRLALGYLQALAGQVPALPGIDDEQVRIVRQQVERGLNTPLTSAAGRLFDAVAALAGVRHSVTYEAQAAIELEMLATGWGANRRPADGPPAYPFDLEPVEGRTVIRLLRLLEAVEQDRARGASPAEIGWRFHRTMAELLVAVCQQLAGETGLRTVALSGGCFQNRLLLALSVPRLEEAGFEVLLHQQVPCNDGGVSLGQVALAQFAQAEV
ncbi:MAG: carbamoyltransferase HypF [Anaerolineae bacterium]|nr:carbamoyltransferase HypF [Anaerolineae bacterium]